MLIATIKGLRVINNQMQRIFERFRNEAEILATELNAEVEIVVKYSFKGKPEISSIFPNERRRYEIKLRNNSKHYPKLPGIMSK
uniref:Ribosome-associated translation inhibitor RaiA n=1 Tax=Loa loa TaxID=7209 RepID=A0A1I7VX03_LOALO